MNITFRKGGMDDLQILRDINYSSFKANEDFDPHIDLNWVNTEVATKYFTDAVTKTDHYTLIAMVDGVAAGYILMEPKEISYRTTKIIEIGIIAVLPEYRSSGIGAQLVDQAKNWAKGYGYETMFVNSYVKNERAISFYKREGFEPIDISLELSL